MDSDVKWFNKQEHQIWTAHPFTQIIMLRFIPGGTTCGAPMRFTHIVEVSTRHRYLEVSMMQHCSETDNPLPYPLVPYTSGIG
jgi:hypothetical protein